MRRSSTSIVCRLRIKQATDPGLWREVFLKYAGSKVSPVALRLHQGGVSGTSPRGDLLR